MDFNAFIFEMYCIKYCFIARTLFFTLMLRLVEFEHMMPLLKFQCPGLVKVFLIEWQ